MQNIYSIRDDIKDIKYTIICGSIMKKNVNMKLKLARVENNLSQQELAFSP